jgi:type IV secretory pathway component VirB8
MVGGQRAITAIPTKKKNSFTKSFFVTLLFVSQRLTYDTKVEKDIFDLVSFRSAQKISNLGFANTFFFRI